MTTKEHALHTPSRGISLVLWDFFCSLKLTLALLILLAATSIIGTVIQQNLSPQEYLQVYSESTYRLFQTLGFFDMYHSWWFLTLLGLFSINLIACSVKRLPKVWKAVREPLLVPGDVHYRTLANVEEKVLPASPQEVQEKIAAALRTGFAPPVITREGEKIHLFAQKGSWSRFGVYVTHLSILIIFLGAIIGNLWGYKGYVNIVEGTAVDKVWPRGGGEPIDLGFSVRADDFDVIYYPGTSRPKEFMSILDVVDGGTEVVSDRKIVVNDPLSYKGITFYQSSYGPAGSPTFTMAVRPVGGGGTTTVTGRLGQPVSLPGGGSFVVTHHTPSHGRFGPAVHVNLHTPAGPRSSFLVLQNYPDFPGNTQGAFAFSLLGFDQPQYTGLQVAKDPGVGVVWSGCLLLVAGSLVAFFLSHRQVWVTLHPVGKGTGLRVGGSAHRNQPAFELFFDDLKKKLHHELSA